MTNGSEHERREAVGKQYEKRVDLLRTLAQNLENETRLALDGHPHIDRIYFRPKEPRSFVEKALDPLVHPAYGNPFVDIEDQVAGRVLTLFLQDLESVKTVLRRTFNAVEAKHHRPKRDEEFGYESHHLILMIPPHLKPKEWDEHTDLPVTFEVQVRTLFMHAWAEPEHELNYQLPGELPADIRRELFWIAASSWGADQALSRILDWHNTHADS